MTNREKLINLIHHASYEVENICNKQADCVGCPAAVCKYKCKSGYIADHLIANGVVISNMKTPNVRSEWISVKDRLPIEEVKKYRGETGEDPEFNVMIKGGLVPTSLFFNGEYWYCNFDDSYAVTHWMPLPEPPKGE